MNAPCDFPILVPVLHSSTPTLTLEHRFLSYCSTLPRSRGRTLLLALALSLSPYRFSSPVSVLGLVLGPPIRSSLLVARYSNARTYSTNIRLMYAPSVRPSAASLEVHVSVLLCSTLSFPSHSRFHSRSHSDCHSESLQLSSVSLSSER